LEGASGDRTGWLVWQDSNLRKAELKRSEPPLTCRWNGASFGPVMGIANDEGPRKRPSVLVSGIPEPLNYIGISIR
jgi:hypothetical protein